MKFGVDVSVHNGDINWRTAASSGVKFAMIKATQGRSVSSNSYLFTDRMFAQNIVGATTAGIPCGVYHYLTAKTVKEAQTEAAHFVKTIAPYKDKISLYAAVDVEEKKYLPYKNRKLLTQIVDAFCAYVAAEGYKPIVYTNPDFLVNYLNDISKWDLWLALWRSASKVPTGYKNLQIWQYGMSNAVDGFTGSVDCNFGYFVADKMATVKTQNAGFKVGDTVKVKSGGNYLYGTKKKFTTWYKEYNVISVKGDRVVIGISKTVTAAVDAANLIFVR